MLRRVLSVLLVAIVMSWCTHAWAIDDPELEYFTITTPHFYVHYHSGIEDLALRVAVISEEAHQIFAPLLEWEPARRTHVNVLDKLDIANGSATVYARNTMNIYGMPPESDSVLGFYDDWLRVLVYHEYVHILHLDTIGGASPYINFVIGKQSNPNQTAPRWFIEGFATYHESKRTRGGRVSGSTWKMWARTAALEGTLLDLGGVAGSPTQWPGGNSAYLYGSLFFDYVFDRHGEDFGNQFNRIYGSRLIPWSLNQTSEEISGETLESMWNQFTAVTQARAQATRLRVRAEGESRIRSITRRAGSHGFARLRPGHGISFYHFDLESSPAYWQLSDGKTTELFEIPGGPGTGDWTPDGKNFVFSQSNVIKNTYSYQDLFMWRSATQTTHRLTHGERARDPAISPDGRWLVYARNKNGTMELVLRELNRVSRAERVLVSDADWQQIAGPRFSPDSKSVVFSRWMLDSGQRDLWTVSVEEGSKPRQLTDDFALDLDPVYESPSSILFSSDRTGIFNIYRLNLENSEVEKLTNVVNGVMQPLRDESGRLWVTHYTSEGYDLGMIDEVRSAPGPSVYDELPVIKYPDIDTSGFTTTDYNPLPELLPLVFIPEFGLITTGSAFGGVLAGYDPVGHHTWSLSGALTTGRELTDKGYNFAAQYSYSRLPVDFAVQARHRLYPNQRGFFAASDFQTFLEEDYVLRGQIGIPFRGIFDNIRLGLSLQAQYVTFDGLPDVEPDPGDIQPSIPESQWQNQAGLSVNYTNVERYPRSVSSEKGFSLGLNLSLQNPFIGSDVQSMTVSYNANAYLPNPWIPRHVLALNYAGGHVSSASGRTGQYTLGGALPQDVLTSVIFQEPAGGRVLRGYPPAHVRGPNFQLLTASYRFPILDMDEGFGTLPVYFRQFKGSVFADTGTAYQGFLADQNLFSSVGAEVILNTTFAYYLAGNLRLGYAYGLSDGGIHDLYLLFGGGF